ncbi:MAG: glycosyltransferase [Candidatus Aminicenantes bacterium]|nr:glycosyltransferase [Acidobacteriota bacterium]MBU4404311.1 glycosyltransferase [Acidobacteriota bacterium]MCG2810908.1 glycosyltransferase [Candidatus Aminicenantes bacterium]
METRKIDISIIVPAKNEGENIRRCLDMVMAQECSYVFEVIVIDSGSQDDTVAIVKENKNIRLVEIRPDEFAHGKTRNLGAKLAKGNFLVFLNADAIPHDHHWLSALIDEFARDKKIAGVYSRHVPKNDCHLYMARDLEKSMPAKRMEKARVDRHDYFLFSTVSATIRKDIWSAYPFLDEILIAEDQNWAARVLQGGYKLVYTPASLVQHSHNYSLKELFNLKCRVGRSSKKFSNKASALFGGAFLALGGMIYKFSGDCRYVLRSGLPVKRKIREIFISLGARIFSFSGRYIGWLKGSRPG